MVSQKYYLINRDYYLQYASTINTKKKLKKRLEIDIVVYHLKKSKKRLIIRKITI